MSQINFKKQILGYVSLVIVMSSLATQAGVYDDDYWNNGSRNTFWSQEYKETSDHRLSFAIAQAKEYILEGRQNYFNKYFEKILVVAAGDHPGIKNLKPILEFLDWGVSQYLISEAQSQMIRIEYFHWEFVSLQDLLISEACLQVKEVSESWDRELRKKEIGLVKALSENDKYLTAKNNYEVLESTLKGYCD